MFRTIAIDQVSIATEVANPEEKNADHLVSPLGLPTEYYPFKICQVPVGHPVFKVDHFHNLRNKGNVPHTS